MMKTLKTTFLQLEKKIGLPYKIEIIQRFN